LAVGRQRGDVNETQQRVNNWMLFEPHSKVKDDPNPDARDPGAMLEKEGVETGGKRKSFIYVNTTGLRGTRSKPSTR